jgi:Flp pilus assembly pilin Flp
MQADFSLHQGQGLGRKRTSDPSKRQPWPLWLRAVHDDRGAIVVEYTVVLVLVALGSVAAMIAIGVPLVGMYLTHRTWLLLPFP